MKRFASFVLSLVLMLTLLPTSFAVSFKPGTYTGEGQGFGGPIKVAVTLSENRIEKVEVTENSETPGIGTPAIENLPAKIVEAQSTQVDVITAATFASKGVIEAVEAALEKAKVTGSASQTSNSVTLNTPSNSFVPNTQNDNRTTEEIATALYDLGLFQGTGSNPDGTPNFDLDRTPTRAEAVTMLVRLLGKDEESKTGNWETPFTDVADWAKPYVGYAYTNGLTTGTSEITFGGTQTIDASQYLTFVLRALGYESGTDFQWDKAWEKSDEIGLTDGRYNAGTTNFTRGDVGIISESALSSKGKTNNTSLLSQLVASGAVTEKAADNYLHPPVMAQTITLNQSNIDLSVGDSQMITATVLPSDTTDKTVTWTSSNPSVATVSNGKITASQPGTATITATTTNEKTATCNVSVIAKPISYSGTGDKVISGISLPFGSYYAEYTHDGQHNFISKLYYGDKSYDYFRISNEIGACSGQVAFYDNGNAAISGGMLEVKADGNWVINFKPVSGTTTTNIKGSGTVVTGLFTATSARNIVSTTHDGAHNFIVKIIKYNGTKSYDYESITNEIGKYSGEKIINLTVGSQYYVYVQADGAWTVNLGLGDSVTTYTPPTIPKSSSNNNSSSSLNNAENNTSFTDDNSKFSYSDISTLNSYANSANTNINKALQSMKESTSGIAAVQAFNVNAAIAYGEASSLYLQNALEILNEKVDIPLTDGTTLATKVQEAYDLLTDLKDTKATDDNVRDIRIDVYQDLATAQSKILTFKNIIGQLLSSYN